MGTKSGANAPSGSGTASPGSASCPASLVLCSGTCVDTRTDRNNCGACGVIVPADRLCRDGQPQPAAATVSTSQQTPFSCGTGLTSCSGSCRDLETDNRNCGMCGYSCRQGEDCEDGRCVISCPAGQTKCSGGACRDLEIDESNCGSCGHECLQSQTCHKGQCADICGSGTSYCSGTCYNLLADPEHCGTCTHACLYGQSCQNGQCTSASAIPTTIPACPTGQTLCSGVCKNLLTDIANCGSCGSACPSSVSHGTVSCQNGQCKVTCDQDYGNCDGIVSNGCEVNLRRDNNNCGTCGNKCQYPYSCWGICTIPK